MEDVRQLLNRGQCAIPPRREVPDPGAHLGGHRGVSACGDESHFDINRAHHNAMKKREHMERWVQQESRRWSRRLCTALGTLLLLAANDAVAQLAVGQAASILFFPKVIADGTRDTVITISNTSNNARMARCFYVNAVLLNPELPEGPTNPPLWQETAFDIFLTKQQPTHWVASRGRARDPSDPPCSPMRADCDGAGLDPGVIPPLATFRGELRCVETDASDAPLPGNSFIGSATLTDVASGAIAPYAAVGSAGMNTNDLDDTLCLGGAVSEQCPSGAEYEGCPTEWYLNNLTDGARDDVDGGDSSVYTELTVVSCAANFADLPPTTLQVEFLVTNAFEQSFSVDTAVTCWANSRLADVSDVFTRTYLGSDYAQIRFRSVGGGSVAVAEQFHQTGGAVSTSRSTAVNLHHDTGAHADVIVLPGSPAP